MIAQTAIDANSLDFKEPKRPRLIRPSGPLAGVTAPIRNQDTARAESDGGLRLVTRRDFVLYAGGARLLGYDGAERAKREAMRRFRSGIFACFIIAMLSTPGFSQRPPS